ncbi:MAG: hypothetical protein KatS3mg047_1217 [Bellilinea sp.]|nr:MAG: hypothetical protein KatS3mg047_1217 [Bellilinea sp.]
MNWVQSYSGLIYFILSLLVYLVVQRRLHREIQGVFLLLTRSPALALGLFALLFFPGVLIHETSHWIAAKLMGVRTGKFSLIPQLQPDGTLRLGYVEAAPVDVFRETIIGAAPFFSGVLAVGWIAAFPLKVFSAGQIQSLASLWASLTEVINLPDFWLWFYLAFTISSTMLPSESDRRAWLPALAIIGLIVLIVIFVGVGEWLLVLVKPINRILSAIALVFVFSLLLHLFLIIPFWLLRKFLSRITGLELI